MTVFKLVTVTWFLDLDQEEKVDFNCQLAYTNSMKTSPKNAVARLRYLGQLLSKYAHCRNEQTGELSYRMYAWIDEYNDLKYEFPTEWKAYCEQYGYSPDHDAVDCTA